MLKCGSTETVREETEGRRVRVSLGSKWVTERRYRIVNRVYSRGYSQLLLLGKEVLPGISHRDTIGS